MNTKKYIVRKPDLVKNKLRIKSHPKFLEIQSLHDDSCKVRPHPHGIQPELVVSNHLLEQLYMNDAIELEEL